MPKILLVEDNEPSRDALGRRLQRRGYDVVLAVDGQEAVSTARQVRPDLVLMDLGLPVIDGWEATRQLKAGAETRAIPIIALTALAMASDERKARDAGCDDFDTKPVDLPRLLEKVERWLGDRPRA
jgi:CheY-like chemotaxis protein